jgi:hypothetical protein
MPDYATRTRRQLLASTRKGCRDKDNDKKPFCLATKGVSTYLRRHERDVEMRTATTRSYGLNRARFKPDRATKYASAALKPLDSFLARVSRPARSHRRQHQAPHYRGADAKEGIFIRPSDPPKHTPIHHPCSILLLKNTYSSTILQSS